MQRSANKNSRNQFALVHSFVSLYTAFNIFPQIKFIAESTMALIFVSNSLSCCQSLGYWTVFTWENILSFASVSHIRSPSWCCLGYHNPQQLPRAYFHLKFETQPNFPSHFGVRRSSFKQQTFLPRIAFTYWDTAGVPC